jgi:hypothetical protein
MQVLPFLPICNCHSASRQYAAISIVLDAVWNRDICLVEIKEIVHGAIPGEGIVIGRHVLDRVLNKPAFGSYGI